MKITVLTLFPHLFQEILSASIMGRAAKKGLVEYKIVDIRQFAETNYKSVDGRPFGGGPGMILRADILAKALKSAQCTGNRGQKKTTVTCNLKTILMSASGNPHTQKRAREFSKLDHLIIVSGHYEGVDQRFIDKYIDEEISIGDYVLTGGELPGAVIIDTVVRLIPGVLKKTDATQDESFSNYTLDAKHCTLLEYPQYTRPEVFEDMEVPKILLSGNHAEIKKWRSEKALEKTKKVRPDLLLKRV